MHLHLFLEQQHKQNGTQTHWDQRVREPTIHRTNSTYICAHRYENEFHAHLIQFETWWSFPYILGQRKKACQRNYMKLICMLKTFKNRYQNTRKYQVKRIPNGEIITWKISLKDTSRNEISNGTLKIKDIKLPKRGWFQTNQALYKVS